MGSNTQCLRVLNLTPDYGRRRLRHSVERVRAKIPNVLVAAITDCCSARRPWPLLVHGAAGVGKTSASLYLADRVIGSVAFRTFDTLCWDIADAKLGRLWWAGTHANTNLTTEEYWMEWSKLTLAIVDDLGARNVSDHSYEVFLNAIDYRHGKPLVVSSNLGPGALADVFDDRIASRLAGGTVVKVDGPDQRLSTMPIHKPFEEASK